MFKMPHILFIVVSLTVSFGMIIGLYFVKNRKAKDAILKSFALATFIIHISIMWVTFLKTEKRKRMTISFSRYIFAIL